MSDREQLFAQPDFIPPLTDARRFKGLRIGLTGQRGVLGEILARRLEASGVPFDAYPGDITDRAAVAGWFSGKTFDLFFHFAARVPLKAVEREPAQAFEINAIGAYRMCEQLAASGRECWTFLCSTSHVYRASPASAPRPLKVGDPEAPASAYGRTKLAGEQLCRQFLELGARRYCIGRVFSFSHRSQKEPYLIPTLARRIAELAAGQRLSVQNPDSVRDIVDAETVIDAVLHLAERRAAGTVNIGSGTGMSVADIARHIAARLGRSVEIEAEVRGEADALVADVEPLRRLIAG